MASAEKRVRNQRAALHDLHGGPVLCAHSCHGAGHRPRRDGHENDRQISRARAMDPDVDASDGDREPLYARSYRRENQLSARRGGHGTDEHHGNGPVGRDHSEPARRWRNAGLERADHRFVHCQRQLLRAYERRWADDRAGSYRREQSGAQYASASSIWLYATVGCRAWASWLGRAECDDVFLLVGTGRSTNSIEPRGDARSDQQFQLDARTARERNVRDLTERRGVVQLRQRDTRGQFCIREHVAPESGVFV